MEDKSDVLLIADYGRSGQGWLSFMLCYILNATYIEPYDFLKGTESSSSDIMTIAIKSNLTTRR